MRRWRREQRAIADQLRGDAAEQRESRQLQRKGKVDERTQAMGWLEEIRNIVARSVRCSLDFTEAEGAAHTPWLIVGRYGLVEPVSYAVLASALLGVANDLGLEVAIHPQRFSQIRIIYHDPHSSRGEGDTWVSQIGGWAFVISDIIGDLVGHGDEDQDALAVRYAETLVPTFYVYFSSEIVKYKTWGGAS